MRSNDRRGDNPSPVVVHTQKPVRRTVDDSAISLIFGISMGMEMLLFYPAGSVMDRWGRKAVALPCLTVRTSRIALAGPAELMGIRAFSILSARSAST